MNLRSSTATESTYRTRAKLWRWKGGKASWFFLTLPASQLEVDLPLIASFPATPQPDAAIEPDIAVATTAGDIAAGRDPQMLAASRHVLGQTSRRVG